MKHVFNKNVFKVIYYLKENSSINMVFGKILEPTSFNYI